MISKKVYNPKSKQHNFGYLLGIFGALLSFLPTVREFIPADQYGNIFIGVSVATIVLRSVTNKPIDNR